MIIKYAHTNIICKDWKKVSNFYIRVFDCILVPPQRNQSGQWLASATGLLGNPYLEGVHLRLPGLGNNGPTLEIYSYKESITQDLPIANRHGFGHIAFEVENVQEIIDLTLNNGGSLLGDIVSNYVENFGTITFTYIRDPENNIVEIQNWKYE